jgi:hypothetical protein
MVIIDAVGASTLPQDLRHLLFTMAYLANSRTARGLSGQETIGRFMGCSGREVRRKLDRLDAETGSPVRVARRYRSRGDGRGRTSDEYQLELTNRTPTSGETEQPSGRPRPHKESTASHVQPDVKRRPTGRETSNQADAHVQGSSEGSSESVLGASLSRPERATAKPAPKAERTPEQAQAHQRVTAHYFAEFERLRGSKPTWGPAEGKQVHVLLEKLHGDVALVCARITNGLTAWEQVTIRVIAADPDKYVNGAKRTAFAGQRAGDLLPKQLRRIAELDAAEASGRVLP